MYNKLKGDCMNNTNTNLTSNETLRGILFIIGGFVLVFYTLGLFSSVLSVFIALGGIAMVAYGVVHANLIERIREISQRRGRASEARREVRHETQTR